MIYMVTAPGEEDIYLFPNGVQALAEKLGYDVLTVTNGGLFGWKQGSTDWEGIPPERVGTEVLKVVRNVNKDN